MAKVILQGTIIIPEAEMEMVLEALGEHISRTRDEAGCLVFEVSQRDENPCILDVYEEFTDKAAFALHQARTKDSTWAQVSANSERHYTISE